MTTLNASQIDAIVRAVVAELNRRQAVAVEPARDVFSGKLLNLAAAESLRHDQTEIRIAPGTVVTPLALDHLKRRKVILSYVSNVTATHRNTGEWAFCLGTTTSGHAAAIRRALLATWTERTEAELVPWLTETSGRGGLLLTNDAALSCWKANQLKGIRAAFIVDADSLARAVKSIGINLAVIEPERLSISQVRMLAESFRQAGAPVAPQGVAS